MIRSTLLSGKDLRARAQSAWIIRVVALEAHCSGITRGEDCFWRDLQFVPAMIFLDLMNLLPSKGRRVSGKLRYRLYCLCL